jgi:hypothetical protein
VGITFFVPAACESTTRPKKTQQEPGCPLGPTYLRSGDVIADSLYDLASVAALRTSDPQAKQICATTRSRIEQACP